MLIGIAGAKRSGKNTLADGLCSAWGLAHLSFASPIRAFVANILGWTADQLEANKELPISWLDGITPRQMMQTVGTEWGRQSVHGELWVRSLLARVPSSGAVISDVRFPNEARAIIDRGGVVIHLSRPGTGEGDDHVSEAPLPDDCVTYRVMNDSSVDALVYYAMLLINTKNASKALSGLSFGRSVVADDLLAADSHVAPQLDAPVTVFDTGPLKRLDTGAIAADFTRDRDATGA